MACMSMAILGLCSYVGPSANLSVSNGSRPRSFVAFKMPPSGLPTTSFLTSSFSSLSTSSSSSFSGLSLGLNYDTGKKTEKSRGLVVRAGKAALCQTKRSRSQKSLACTHGFRKRMSTTSGRAITKRRCAKGRWKLCTKTNHNSGKQYR
ncbi:50S ribosomal protein L34, chloroplastic [Heracleum sosnowskyi]|uniref:50S ribosomal protein L34, chloroplastic n=1 Tax=Heracleum sosnowskyi TaxID=360622 RepID=A0AAD8J086_9APIA|nr:50S ribosomal protein L34, chloroplastic [Heracleum sosnowskyi]